MRAVQPREQPRAVLPRRHILDLDDFTREEIETVFRITDGMKEILTRQIKKVPTLRGTTVLTHFYEPSTRTRGSFEQAGKILGADVINVTTSTSSVVKGESLVDTGRTLQAVRADVIVIRHASAGAPYLLAQHLQCSVVNAGDGAHAHPTQALLDLYTIREKLGRVEGLKVAIVGDILYSRVARSNLWGLSTMGARVVLCGPPPLLPAGFPLPADAVGAGGPALPPVTVETDVDRALDGADVVMALRIQHERTKGGLLPSVTEYARRYQVTEERMKRAKPGALVLHPGPMNEGVEISPDVAHGTQSVIQEQVTNGVAVRMALLYLLCAREA